MASHGYLKLASVVMALSIVSLNKPSHSERMTSFCCAGIKINIDDLRIREDNPDSIARYWSKREGVQRLMQVNVHCV